jgi:hypothetical protein
MGWDIPSFSSIGQAVSNLGQGAANLADQATGGRGDGSRSGVDIFADAVVNYMTGGIVGVHNGRIAPMGGALTRAGGEVLGEITGRNMARDAANDAHNRLLAEDAARAKQLADERLQVENQDMAASRRAGAGRIAGGFKTSGLGWNDGTTQDQKDFLGI